MRHRVFKLSLVGIASVLITLGMSIPAGAAISNGPNYTNAVAAEEQRIFQFHQAQQSYEEKLRVGRERYDQKQMNRAKIIEAMSSELQARRQTVVLQPVAAPDGPTEEQVLSFRSSLVVAVLAAVLVGLGVCKIRPHAQGAPGQKRRPIPNPAPKRQAVAIPLAEEIFFCKSFGADGRGRQTPEGFMVLKGSFGCKESAASIVDQSAEPFRVKLLDLGVVRKEGGKVIFEKDHLFRSPSMAATALLGRTANGWLEWKTKGNVTLDRAQRLEPRA